MSLYLSRLRLRRDAALSALAPVLAPDDGSGRADRSHRLLWAVFSDGPDRKRDFLWREEDLGRFLVLSARAPLDPHHLFEIETKPFEPELAKGDKLRFVLRTNAVVSQKTDGSRGRRDDIVMHRLHAVPKGFERAQRRDEIAREAGRDWLINQGTKAGFAVATCDAAGYRTLAVPREGKLPIQLGVLDLEGRIEIEDFSAFLPALTRGFGKAKGFGCGLMLIARAR
jgi:CRISPR system Cascade subunit CasE